MTDAQVTKLAEVIRRGDPQPPRTGENRVYITVCAAVVVYFATTQLQKTDAGALGLATMTSQMSALSTQVSGLRDEVKSLSGDLVAARVDPFNGADGAALQDRLEERVRRTEESLRDEIDRISDDLRKIHSATVRTGGGE